MAIEDILLRTTSYPPLTAKGSQLTWEELDNNFVEVYNGLYSQYQSSYVDSYDNTETYDDTINNYANYSGVVWKWINTTPGAGVTPGTDATKWERVYATDLSHKKNSDTILAEGTPDEVSASEIKSLVSDLGSLTPGYIPIMDLGSIPGLIDSPIFDTGSTIVVTSRDVINQPTLAVQAKDQYIYWAGYDTDNAAATLLLVTDSVNFNGGALLCLDTSQNTRSIIAANGGYVTGNFGINTNGIPTDASLEIIGGGASSLTKGILYKNNNGDVLITGKDNGDFIIGDYDEGDSTVQVSGNGRTYLQKWYDDLNATVAVLTEPGRFGLGTVTPGAKQHTVGEGITTGKTALFQNNNGDDLFIIQDDGYIYAGATNGSITIGANSGFDNSIAANTFVGVGIATGAFSGIANTSVGYSTMVSLSTGIENAAFGYFALMNLTTGFNNNAFGSGALTDLTTGANNIAIGAHSMYVATNDIQNVAIGSNSMLAANGSFFNVAIGQDSLRSIVAKTRNTAIGYASGYSGNINGGTYLGYFSGYYETVDDKLFIDNRDRTSEALSRTLSLVYGGFATTTTGQWFTLNSNVGVGTSIFGTNSDFVFAMANGVAPTTNIANQFQQYSADIAAGNAAPHFKTENGDVIKLYKQGLTDSTGGASSGDLEDVTTAGVADPAKVNNNFKEIYTILNNLGLI